jgi:teichuronic acid exporter
MFLAGVMTWRYEYFFQLLTQASQAKLLFKWIVKLGISIGIIATIIFYILGDEVSSFLGAKGLNYYLVLAPLAAFFVSIALALQHNVQREGRFKVSAASEVAGKLSYVGFGVLLSSLGSVGIVTTNVFSAFGKICFLWKELIKIVSVNARGANTEAHPRFVHMGGASAMVLSHVFLTVGTAAPIFFISHQYGVVTLGQFTMVMATIFLPSGLLGFAIGQVFYQRAAKYFQEARDIKMLWWETVRKLFLFGFPIYVIAVVFSGYIYPLVLGAQWKTAGQYAQIFSVAAFFSFISTPLDRISLILRINGYLPLMHLFRMLTSIGLMVFATFYELDFMTYLLCMTCQMSIMYALDMGCGWAFLNKAATG